MKRFTNVKSGGGNFDITTSRVKSPVVFGDKWEHYLLSKVVVSQNFPRVLL